MRYTAVRSDKLDTRAGAGFALLGEFDHVLVGVADADVHDSRGLLCRLGAQVDEEAADDGGKYDQADGNIFAL